LPRRSALCLGHEHQIPDVDDKAHRLAENDDRIVTRNRVSQKCQTAKEAKPPECHRHNRVSIPLRYKPLHHEPRSEERLAEKAHDQPAVQA
jgi:hypothetical protein